MKRGDAGGNFRPGARMAKAPAFAGAHKDLNDGE
jgi:hypothetical protein